MEAESEFNQWKSNKEENSLIKTKYMESDNCAAIYLYTYKLRQV